VLARAAGLFGPFGRGWQNLGAIYGILARNYLRYGFVATHFAGVLAPGPAAPSEWSYYMHHPPGFAWLLAGSMALFGPTAFAVKITGVFAGVVQCVVTYLLVSRVLSRRAGLAAALATAALPAGAYFSTHGSELGPQGMTAVLAAILVDDRSRRDGRSGTVGTLVALGVSFLLSWVAVLAALAIALRGAFERRWRRAAVVAATIPLAFALQLLHIRLVTGSFDGGEGGSLFAAAFFHGLPGMAEALPGFDPRLFVGRAWHHLLFLFTIPGLVVAAAGAVAWLFRRRIPGLRDRPAGALLATFAIVGFGYVACFPRAMIVHRYWMLVLLPLVSLLSGLLVQALSTSRVGGALALAAVLAAAVDGTCVSVAAHMADRTPYYETFGRTLAELTPAGTTIVTTERFSPILEFYSERRIVGDVGDACPGFGRDSKATVAPNACAALLEPPIDPPDRRVQELERFLESHYACREAPLEGLHATLRLFDLGRTIDGAAGGGSKPRKR
jgi:4-amino-4-deoxy-L-arabinose transferase-like glycosyltransferase